MSGILSAICTNYNATPPTPPVTYATWNPADKGTSISLSNSDLTITSIGINSSSSIRSTIGKSSGKWYWEISGFSSTLSGDWNNPGLANTNAIVSSLLGNDVNSYMTQVLEQTIGFQIYHNNSWTGLSAYPISSITDVYGYALDMDNGTLVTYKNGNLVGTLATGLSGTWYPAYTTIVQPGHTEMVTATANFGATPFAYTPPVGFNAGLYE